MAPDSSGRVPIRRALLSVHDPRGVAEFGRGLRSAGAELWATQGTRRGLTSAGVDSQAAEELTGIGSWFGGRIKTLHPGLLGGILAPRTPAGTAELAERHLLPIDLVAVNFYPFAQTFARDPRATDLEEMIDIGGVTLARAAAKNHAAVAIVSDPSQYPSVLAELLEHPEGLSAATRRVLAAAAFGRTQAYDRLIASALGPADTTGAFPRTLEFEPDPVSLRYGENPHQAAQPYLLRSDGSSPFEPFPVERLQGEPLSYTNLVDLDTALAIVAEFPTPTAAVVKHATPCGVASGSTIREALARAVATDPVARYGCAIAVNRPMGEGAHESLHGVFVDLLGAPAVAPEEREALAKRSKLKLVRVAPPPLDRPRWEAKSALGRLLVQQADRRELLPTDFRLAAGAKVTPEQACALDFAWRVVRHAKSNAIVLAQGSTTVGIGSGQPTRVKAVELACEVAGDRAHGAVLASDAFFPFADGVEVAAKAGVRAILQPGGSLRDPEVIAMAERHGVAMYMTGWRVFRH